MATAFASPEETPLYRGNRDHSRARLSVPARLITCQDTVDCMLVDLSCSGAKVATARCPRVGVMVVIESLPFELFGTVRWSRQGFFGFEFDVPLPTERVIELRHYADLEVQRQKAAEIEYARGWVTGVYSNSR